MKITLFFFGKKTEITDREKELMKRIGFRTKFEIIPLAQAGLRDTEKTKEKEADEFLKKIKEKDFLVLFDEKGEEMDSPKFFEWLKKQIVERGEIVFLIGGAYGFHEKIIHHAHKKICFGRMVWTRNLFRHMALEQIYRALEIDGGSHFHKI